MALVGRPVSSAIDPRRVIEVNRCAVREGIKNGCSALYGAAARASQEMGFYAIITYTLTSESGASLRALGWWSETLAKRNTLWDCEARPREASKGQGLGQKIRWLRLLSEYPDVVPDAWDGDSQKSLDLGAA